jgi:predicted ATP-grasp superfamily ATP-dependent carboligase
MADSQPLLIFGASARAAAFSALRAGLDPWCVDLFADEDLRACCPGFRLLGRYPEGFLDALENAPPGPWMYTGGLENWPQLVRQLVGRRLLWGNDDAALACARDPAFVTRVLRVSGLPAPRCYVGEPPAGEGWLVKPLRGAGGTGIRFSQGDADPAIRSTRHYCQEFIEGDPCAAVYAAGARCELLGLTRQLVGAPFLHSAPFHYCGSIGPLPVEAPLRKQLERLGKILTRACQLRGLFGVDGVLRDGVFWPVEVNPRYTASVEVIEHATGLRALDWHRHACDPTAPVSPVLPTSAAAFVGKAILFARQPLVFPALGPWLQSLDCPPQERPAFADIPVAGHCIERGKPILTFFATAASVSACHDALRQQAAELDRLLIP